MITILVENSETNKNYTYQITVNKSKVNDKLINPAMKKAQTIRRIIFGILGTAIVGIVLFIIIKQKNSRIDDYDEEYEESENSIEDDYKEEQIDKIDEELFKRVNKELFKPISDDTLIIDNEDISSKKIIENEETNKKIIDDYFSSGDTKRKGKHF